MTLAYFPMITLNTGTEKPEKTVWTLIRLLLELPLKEQSELQEQTDHGQNFLSLP